MNRRLCLQMTVGVWCVVVAAPVAQQDAPSFQFVSIRIVPSTCPAGVVCIGEGGRIPSTAPQSVSVLPGGRFEARNQTFENLARIAFGFEGVDPRQGIVETPRFFFPGRERFDITAVTDQEWSAPPPGELMPAELRPMLRSLLEERFQMQARLETKRVDVYAVRLANEHGEPGPRLRPSTGECLGPYTDPPRDEALSAPACPFTLEPNRVEAGAVTMAEVARIISRIQGFQLDRVVVDGTGMEGRYDLELSIDLPTPVPSPFTAGGAASADGTPVFDQIRLSDRRPLAIREALREQLGLTLERARLPIPTLRIERAKKPEED
jgi:uncharacterized protein (TIGR03435 family)